MENRRAAVADLWTAHTRAAAFPDRLRGTDVAGVCTVMVDADVAGCVRAWLQRDGTIDNWRRDILAACEQDLLRVIPELDGYEAAYYQRLLDMTVLVLNARDDALSK